ncbi:hypothetical protein FRAAL6254 [Frankia alni ACN14a]|uniref:Uncharacterized protein n=1 Tax=Frankia alni (strain DSM 45986 / CECT 9034 / ACN14a) TaxID=326424 RepID=Q0RCE8_FRAAA|nr:hypothetical protein FRAAL6254 [Frankia alni ACN14a]
MLVHDPTGRTRGYRPAQRAERR